jgi:hypothetical protein
VADHPERWRSPFTQVEMRGMWTYTDGARTVRGYWWPGGTARTGSWVLVDQVTGNIQGVVPAGEFSRRFRPVDVFADVPGLPAYLGTVTAPDGTALVDLPPPASAELTESLSAGVGNAFDRYDMRHTGTT